MTWLNVIVGRLSVVDPVNSDAYLANAASGRAVIQALMDEVGTSLAPVRIPEFICSVTPTNILRRILISLHLGQFRCVIPLVLSQHALWKFEVRSQDAGLLTCLPSRSSTVV